MTCYVSSGTLNPIHSLTLVYELLRGAVVVMETAQLALNPYQAFQTQSIRN